MVLPTEQAFHDDQREPGDLAPLFGARYVFCVLSAPAGDRIVGSRVR